MARKIGIKDSVDCPNCKNKNGNKLGIDNIYDLAQDFFINGTSSIRLPNIINFNEYQETCIDVNEKLRKDIKIFENSLEIGFFYNTPKLYEVGDTDILENLSNSDTRLNIIKKIFAKYPIYFTKENDVLYRIRKNPENINEHLEYDSPPKKSQDDYRFNLEKLPVMYASKDIDTCVYESRIKVKFY
jgi:hypothetical protein